MKQIAPVKIGLQFRKDIMLQKRRNNVIYLTFNNICRDIYFILTSIFFLANSSLCFFLMNWYNMKFHWMPRRESFLANVTIKWLLLFMNYWNMSIYITFCMTTVITNLAFKLFFPSWTDDSICAFITHFPEQV